MCVAPPPPTPYPNPVEEVFLREQHKCLIIQGFSLSKFTLNIKKVKGRQAGVAYWLCIDL